MIGVFFDLTQVSLIVCGLCAIIVGIKQKNRNREMRYIIYYPVASVIETITSPIINFEIPKLKNLGMADISTNIFLLIEFIIIYHYFHQILKSKSKRKSLWVISIFYISVTAFFWIYKKTFNNNPDILFVPQAICILYPTFCSFFELLRNPSRIELISEPSFWLITGILLYFGCTLPLFLLNDLIDFSKEFEKSIFSINFLCYSFCSS